MKIFDFQVKAPRMGAYTVSRADWMACPREGEAQS
jgi:hypothetical protein